MSLPPTQPLLPDEALALLARAGQVLGSSLDVEQTLRRLGELVVPRLADVMTAIIVDPETDGIQLEVVHATPELTGLLATFGGRYPAADRATSPVVMAAREQRIVRNDDVDLGGLAALANDDEQLAALAASRLRAYLAVPMVARGNVVGALGMSLHGTRRFDPTAPALAQELATRAALAIDTGRLIAAERQARIRSEIQRLAAERSAAFNERLQRLTALLAETRTVADIADVFVRAALSPMGAAAGVFSLVDESAGVLDCVRTAGYAEAAVAPFRRLPLTTDTPLTDAVRRREPVYLESRALRAAGYPLLEPRMPRTDYQAWIALPLMLRDRVLGAVGASFAEARPFAADERAFLEAVASQFAQAVSRAQLAVAQAGAEATLAVSRRTAERRLAELEAIYDSAPIGMCMFDRDGRFVRINELLAAANGTPAEAHVGRTVAEIVPQLKEAADHLFARAMAGEAITNVEISGQTAAQPGVDRYWRESWSPVRDRDGTIVGVSVLAEEITERRRAEEALRASEERLRLATQEAGMATWDYDLRTERLVWSEAHFRIFGYAPVPDGRATPEMYLSRIHPDDVAGVQRDMDVARESRTLFAREHRIRRADDDSVVWIAPLGRFIYDEDGAPVRFIGLFFESTERRRAEEALRASEARYRALVTAASSIVWVTNPAGEVTEPQPSWEAYTGQPFEEYRGFGWSARIHPDDKQHAVDEWLRSLATGAPYLVRIRVWSHAHRAFRHVVVRAVPVLEPDGAIREWVGTVGDIEDQWVAEEQLRQSAKMDAVGRLAGGLAHDFNNQLHALSGFAEFVARDSGLSARARNDVNEIQQSAARMASLTRQLLAFSRQQVLTPETLDLNAAVADTQPLLQRLIGSNIEFRVELAPGVRWVRVDRAQLLQVLMNLAINARDAMPDGGDLVVRTRTRAVTAGELDQTARGSVRSGTYAELSVADSGTGIPPEALPHIFEPFFTTKEVGKGTGLGLATVDGIVAQSGGHIWAEARRGGGMLFTVLLPLTLEPPAGALAESNGAGERSAAATATVLVVDDEDIVRRVIARTLEEAGYEVMQARHGGEALERLAQARGLIDLIVTDILMPVMGGRELGERIAADHPELPLVWMSGYPRDEAFTSISDDAFPFLQKPVAPDLLVATVKRMLESRPAGAESADGRGNR